jgi:hypothetical protein
MSKEGIEEEVPDRELEMAFDRRHHNNPIIEEQRGRLLLLLLFQLREADQFLQDIG